MVWIVTGNWQTVQTQTLREFDTLGRFSNILPLFYICFSTIIIHTCHISHCELKSHRIWPIWTAIPIKNSNLTEFSDHFTTDFLWRNKHESHTTLVFTSFLHEKKDYWGSSKVIFKKISQNFVKSPLKFCLISQILVHICLQVFALDAG